MTMTDARSPLTRSGRGLKITDRPATSLPVDEARALLARYRWLAFTGHPLGAEEVFDYVSKFGPLVQNDRRQGGVLKLDGSQKDEVLLGEGPMPLHRDGVLMGADVSMVGIHCLEYQDVTGGGRTFVSDVEGAAHDVPRHIIDLLRERGLEGRPVDHYYLKAADRWHWVPGFVELEGQSYLNGGFPYRPGEKASWEMRIPGVAEEQFHAMYETMRAIMMGETYCYYHEWREGDLLLIDNRRTLHGREAFRGRRSLANIQVLAG